MKRYLMTLLLLIATPAEAQFRTAIDWAALPPESRKTYIEGARDTLAWLTSMGQTPLTKTIDACLNDTRYSNSEWLALAMQDRVKKDASLAKRNAAELTFGYLEHLCKETASVRGSYRTEAFIGLGAFTALPAPSQASYVEAVQDSLEPSARRDKEGKLAKDRECLNRNGLADSAKLADAAVKYALSQESRFKKDTSFAQIVYYFMREQCS